MQMKKKLSVEKQGDNQSGRLGYRSLGSGLGSHVQRRKDLLHCGWRGQWAWASMQVN